MRIASLAASLLLGACSVVGIRSGTEEPRYEVLDTVGPLEVRRYAERVAAEVAVPGEEEAARSAGFRVLARYIFGENQARQEIAMTAPVEQSGQRIAMTAPVDQQRDADGAWRIRFFMPAKYTLATLPRPRDAAVQLVTMPAETYAVLRFSGGWGNATLAERQAELLGSLNGTPWRVLGTPQAWFYDPPWTLPPLRRNEVAVRVERGA